MSESEASGGQASGGQASGGKTVEQKPEPPAAASFRGQVTLLLENLRGGNAHAVEDLLTVVYRELRKTARSLLRKESQGHTLKATDLVHEAYFRLFDTEKLQWHDRAHFFGSAARAMRRILIDHARRKQAGKRIPKDELVPMDVAIEPAVQSNVDLLALDMALDRLTKSNARAARIVELRYFAGLTETEVAEVLDISRMTVCREWRVARLWLRREMGP